MNAKLMIRPRRWMLVLATAFVLAATAASVPIWLDGLTGTALTPAVYACQLPNGGCG